MKISRLMTKQTKWPLRPAKTQISLGIRPVWSDSSQSAWRNIWFSATHWAHCEDSDRTGRTDHFVGFVMKRVIFATLCENHVTFKAVTSCHMKMFVSYALHCYTLQEVLYSLLLKRNTFSPNCQNGDLWRRWINYSVMHYNLYCASTTKRTDEKKRVLGEAMDQQ